MCSRGHGLVVHWLAGWSVVMNDGIDMGGGCHFLGERNEGGKARQTANQTNGPVALPQKSAHVATRLEDDSCDYVGQRGQRATDAAAQPRPTSPLNTSVSAWHLVWIRKSFPLALISA